MVCFGQLPSLPNTSACAFQSDTAIAGEGLVVEVEGKALTGREMILPMRWHPYGKKHHMLRHQTSVYNFI